LDGAECFEVAERDHRQRRQVLVKLKLTSVDMPIQHGNLLIIFLSNLSMIFADYKVNVDHEWTQEFPAEAKSERDLDFIT
jgi:hypothetical protein